MPREGVSRQREPGSAPRVSQHQHQKYPPVPLCPPAPSKDTHTCVPHNQGHMGWTSALSPRGPSSPQEGPPGEVGPSRWLAGPTQGHRGVGPGLRDHSVVGLGVPRERGEEVSDTGMS